MSTRETHWQEISLDLVLREFVKGYTLPEGTTLVDHEAYVDISKRKVVFKLITSKDHATD